MKKHAKINIKPIDSRVNRVIKLLEKVSIFFDIPLYFTGGLVRDTIMGVKNLDIDLFVEKFDISFIETLEQILSTKFKIYPEFFTATTTLENNVSIDISLMRKEFYEFSGVLPKILPGNFIENLQRRDFTINSIVIHKNKIFDLNNGIKAISKKTLTSLYKESFRDDPTRILRGVKFALRFDFFFDKNTYKEVLFAFHNSYFFNISDTRFFRELNFIFQEKNISDLFSQEKYSEIFENLFGSFNKIMFIEFCDFYKKNIKLLKYLNLFKKNNLFDFFMFFLKFHKINSNLNSNNNNNNNNNNNDNNNNNNNNDHHISDINYHFSKLESFFYAKNPYYKVSQKFIEVSQENKTLNKNSEIYSQYKTLSNLEIFILIFLCNYKNSNFNKKIKMSKTKNQLKKYLSLRKNLALVNGSDLINIGFSPSPEFQTILDKIYLIQLDNPNFAKDKLLELILNDKRV